MTEAIRISVDHERGTVHVLRPATAPIVEVVTAKPKRKRRKRAKLIGGMMTLRSFTPGEPDPALAHWLAMAAPDSFTHAKPLPWRSAAAWLLVALIILAVLAGVSR